MARRKRASMREGPLAALFRSTADDVKESEEERRRAEDAEAAREQQEQPPPEPATEATRVAREPDPTRVAREPEPPPREPVEAPPEPEHVTAYRRDEPAERPPEPSAPGAKERLKQFFGEDVPSDMMEGPTYGREEPDAEHTLRTPRVNRPVLRVVGVGGAGVNAVNRMVEAGVQGVEFMAVNTDLQSLQQSTADVTVHIGAELTRGLGSGSDPVLGYRAAFDEQDKIKRMLKGSDMVFITAGAGGGTGTGAAPIVARLAREVDALTVGIITKPFGFEGTRRSSQAEEGIASLAEEVDTLIVVPNDRLTAVLDRKTSMVEAFRVADDVLRQGVQGISDLVTLPGLINLDFADVRTVMTDAGQALLGIGMGVGEARAEGAAEKAVSSPLLETSMEGARSILLSVTGGPDLSLVEVSDAAKVVQDAAHPEANIIFGANVDDELSEQVWVTVVATRFSGRDRSPVRRADTPTVRRTSPRTRGEERTRTLRGGDMDVPEFIPGG